MLFRRDVAKHRCAVPTNLRRANATRDVVIAWCDIGNQWSQGIEGRL